tara:strand:- start:8535 stop:8948 length:414 start_codon:yes stop_codon:yes gene_type:complete
MSTLKADKISGTASTGVVIVTGEGGTNTASLQQGLAKMWANINQSTPAASDSVNVASLTDHATGRVGANLTTNMSNTNYVFAMTGFDASSAGAGEAVHHGLDNQSQSTSQCNHVSYNWSGSNVDNTKASMVIFGDLS